MLAFMTTPQTDFPALPDPCPLLSWCCGKQEITAQTCHDLKPFGLKANWNHFCSVLSWFLWMCHLLLTAFLPMCFESFHQTCQNTSEIITSFKVMYILDTSNEVFKLYPTAFPQKQMTKHCVQNAAWKHSQDPAPMGLMGLLNSKEISGNEVLVVKPVLVLVSICRHNCVELCPVMQRCCYICMQATMLFTSKNSTANYFWLPSLLQGNMWMPFLTQILNHSEEWAVQLCLSLILRSTWFMASSVTGWIHQP